MRMIRAPLGWSAVACALLLAPALPSRAQEPPVAPPAAADEEEAAAPEALRLIRGLLRDGLEEAALGQIRSFLENHPANPAAAEMRFHEGRILLARGEADDAAECLSLLLEQHPESPYAAEGAYLCAVAERLRGRPGEAERLFVRALGEENLPDKLRRAAGLRLAAVRRGLGRCEEALEALAPLEASAAVLLESARCRYALKDFKNARRDLTGALKPSAPGEAALEPEEEREARRMLGFIAFHEKRYKEARDILAPLVYGETDASGIFPQTESALAWTHYHLGDYGQAYDMVRRRSPALRLSEREEALLAARGALARGEDGAAREALTAVLESEPEDAEAHALLGEILRRAGDAEGAAEHLRRASRLLPVSEGAALLFDVGEIHYGEMRDFHAARRIFEALAATPGHGMRAPSMLYAARSALGEGDRAGALAWLAALVEEYPQNSSTAEEAYYLLTELYTALGQHENALGMTEIFLREFSDSPRGPAALLRKSDLEERLGASEEAASSYRFFLARYPEDRAAPRAHLLLARVLSAQGAWSEAVEVLKALRKKFPDSEESRQDAPHETGRALLETERAEEALAAFLEDAALNPPRGHYWAARAALAAEDAEQAVAYFEKAHEAAPHGDLGQEALREAAKIALSSGDEESSVALLRRLRKGDVLYARYAQTALERHFLGQGKVKEALEEIPEFMRGNPAVALDSGKILVRAKGRYEAGNINEARRDFEEILEKFPNSEAAAEAHFHLGEIAFAEGRMQASDAHNRSALEGRLPDAFRARAHYRLGASAFERKDFSQAARHFDEAEKTPAKALRGLRPTILYLAGVCYEQEHEPEEARRRYLGFAEALEDRAAMQDEQLRAALFLQREGYAQDSLALCEALLAVVETEDLRTEVQFYLAENYKTLGDLDRALLEYLKVTYLHPENAMWAVTARFEAGQIYEKQGKWDEAVKLYRRIAEAAPGSAQSEAARRRLEEITEHGAESPPELSSEEVD
ncbi:MAG: tetratricopeptide repeat protein [Acidobacteriota bacterium]|nr:MAG: tetratricopeptide repeat protein [Acidobacteriota bacterium]